MPKSKSRSDPSASTSSNGQTQMQDLPGRMLHRAANLLTTKGEPVPAIAETLFQLESQSATASPSDIVASSLNSQLNKPHSSALTRRKSESSASLGGSIKRGLVKVKDVSVTVVRRGSFKRQKSSSEKSIRDPSINEAGSSTTAASSRPPSRPSDNKKAHRRSYSDVLWTRPKFWYSSSEPTIQTIREERSSLTIPNSTFSPIQEHLPHLSPSIANHPPSPSSATTRTVKMEEFKVPGLLQQGVPMLKVSSRKQKKYIFKLDPDQGRIVWESKSLRFIPIENIKELRSGADARYYRELFQLSQEYETKWLTIVYVLDGGYKTLHLIAVTKDIFQMWDITLRKLYDIRQQLMSGVGNVEMRQAVWEKQFWAGADEGADQKLDFDDVEKLCRRLNINPSREDLLRRFKTADVQNRGFLDFTDFRRFVKSLKARPEIDRLYKKLSKDSNGVLNYAAFERFMRHYQKSSLSNSELQKLFVRYASLPPSPPTSAPGSPPHNPLELTTKAPETPGPAAVSASASLSTSPDTASSTQLVAATGPDVTYQTGVISIKAFTSFLLSVDNAAFADQHGKIFHDMTRPLPEYFISSSHNTYLVGHQLVGESTVEGYIRALLHSCRSVELDIYDGDKEPMVYHGRTFTSKVSLREACKAIAKYAFVTSPYPVIISAEVHCGLAQQAMIASIMMDVFGDALVTAPVDGRPKIEALPSPEDLKGRVLLKAKNLYVSEKEGIQEKDLTVDGESSSTETSASDTDFKEEIKHEWRKARENEVEVIKDIKSEFKKARSVFDRVRSGSSSKGGSSPKSAPAKIQPVASSQSGQTQPEKPKVKMSFELVALLVYTVGVKCRGINKKEEYAPEHVFSLSENTANRLLKQSMMDLIKHNRTHVVRIYPKGTRIGSTNYEPHRYWSAGAQLVAINWQTMDLGYMINNAMFQRNGRAGYVLKPLALRTTDKQLLGKRTEHWLDVKVISAQQLPRPRDASGREIIDKSIMDPLVEVSIHIPDWTHSPFLPTTAGEQPQYSPPTGSSITSATSARTITVRSGVVKNNGFNPVWEDDLSLPFDCVGDMRDLIFVRFAVKQEDKEDDEPLAVYCCSLGSLNLGYRHLPLHDARLSQYLFSTLFVRIDIRNA